MDIILDMDGTLIDDDRLYQSRPYLEKKSYHIVSIILIRSLYGPMLLKNSMTRFMKKY